MSRLPTFLIGAAAGAAAAHFLDPESGRRRRAKARQGATEAAHKAESVAGQAKETAAGAAQKAQSVAGSAAGAAHKAQAVAGQTKGAVTSAVPGTGLRDADDVTLARKVETEIFRAADAPKGDVSVDVQAGVAYLRGEVSDDAWRDRLADEASHVDGIKGVENLLHPPGTPAPAAEPRGAVTER
jgi:osmotically-inducible protein OsmY